ncbi:MULTISPECIES: hypothetical protein [Phytobacter]|uniref:Uncharacterized protein n=1 Tax=Phytobacter diazotrophicus TaxID=395631 RepID=A0ABN6LR13_9ENTR|nr:MULTISPECIES: hypothetical protein [Phytobacter]MDU4153459.1 hypothetical protein [Enterobacteriaceae bacterium]MDU7376763.1 hypothetical protein [Enterobacteriaceae bacterium]BBE78266.1 hypothetical protein MRY16398_33220 [Phytobacter sp. MRY16-398]BDD51643.1 hypothetical protein PDTA9734_31300 [Phytobacter diazotrophicus]BEG85273.1 hypothetical protein PDTA9730_57290 [Phytobacter diazotrophicus]
MSHSSSRRKVLDIEGLLAHRASHARSCTNHVANRLGITRSELLMKVEKETGASLISPLTEDELMKAFNFGELSYVQQIELFKRSYLEKKNYAKPFYEKTAAKKTNAPSWDQLDQKIKDVVVDIFYQGIRHPASLIEAAIAGRTALINFIREDSSLMRYEPTRHRIRYLQ